MHIIAAVVFGLSVGAFTVAAPAESNGERLARGLPPLRPEFGRILPGFVNTHNPTPAFGLYNSYRTLAVPHYTCSCEAWTSILCPYHVTHLPASYRAQTLSDFQYEDTPVK